MLKNFFEKKIKINTDEKKISEVVSRGVVKNFPSDEFLRKKLSSGVAQKIYLGIDPTGPTLHMGHAVSLKKLQALQKMGHKIILLIGDFTARIGDPDKKNVRSQLSHKEVLENSKLYKKQAEVFLNFSGKNPASLKYNHNWLSKLNFEDVIKLCSKVTVQRMLDRDMFRKRMTEEKPIYLHEFLYPLMQGYDAVAMDVDGEIGGNDQTFNMLTGRDLMKEYSGKEKFVIPMKLLVDNSGSKMGKTTGNMLSFLDSADEMFGKIMSWNDEMIVLGFELLTDKNLEEITKRLESGENPKNLKTELALEIIEIFYNKEKAQKAQKNWQAQFSERGIPENLEEIEILNGEKILEVLKKAEFIFSNKEGKRKIDEKAVQIDGEKILDYDFSFNKNGEKILKLGKKMKKIIIK